ncbi:NAD-dependent epimerase/dehydratase family protein [Photobacterium phosphoreum]|uniref:SDR family oxidoreductase n=1 Tax=Photobacterium phosphoreum TaxID=659 RepID=UPI001E358CD9|nr:NAD(P)-dependent oxidoreductase [Photobacterium phosphoreum]MCD9504167.1 NAD-dependent epimerase/dehydratase family protein [Photobacterium phosphoreum]
MIKYTIIGGSGFIGSELANYLKENKEKIWVPSRNDESIFTKDLGILIYCAGFGDCVNHPINVFDANVLYLSKILEKCQFEKLIYLSSTRLYLNQNSSNESDNLVIFSNDSRRLFNLTKITAEELCLKSNRKCCIIRPSNVYGNAFTSPLFLPSITRNAIKDKCVNMYVTEKYEKDYVSVYDVIDAVYQLSILDSSLPKIVNIASGINTSALDIAETLIRETNCKVNWLNNGNDTETFPVIDISLLKSIINYSPRSVLSDLNEMIGKFKTIIK